MDALRDSGYDATHLHEEGLDRMPDSDILAKARTEGRVVLTHDLDFGELMAASQARLPGVVIFRLRDMRPTRVRLHLEAVIARYGEQLTRGAVVSVSEGQIRVRSLPIAP